MISIEGHVVVIYLVFLQPKKSWEQDIFGRRSSKVVSMRSRSVTLVRCLHVICTHMLPRYIRLSPLVPSPKWELDFMDFNPASAGVHHHIIVAINYFMKWVEASPTIKSNGETAVHFIFNKIITQFGILKELVTKNGRHF